MSNKEKEEMEDKGQFMHFVRRRRRFTLKSATQHGFSRALVAYHVSKGDIVRLARGLYGDPSSGQSAFADYEALAASGCEFTVALFSALRLHGFTTANPMEVWIALPKDAKKPRTAEVPVRAVWMGNESYRYGVKRLCSGGVSFKVFTAAKTVADLFKFRNKYGLDIALEALRDGWRKRLFTMDELREAAKVCRMVRIMSPYLEGLLA
ncbi:MAG: transcriptional regulator [Kiritimatiellae bacterium]|nr:transcriptional regulator [Kiritimatiellia bacterium]